MKTKLLCLALVLSGGLFGCATKPSSIVQAVEPPFPADLRIAITNVSSGKTSAKEASRITSEIERWIFTNAVNHSLAEISGTLRREHLLLDANKISWGKINEASPANDCEVDALYLKRGTNEWLAVNVYLLREEEVDTNDSNFFYTTDGQREPPLVLYESAPPVIFRKVGTNVMLFETGPALKEHRLKEGYDLPGNPDLFVPEISKWRLLGFIPGVESSNIPDVMVSEGPDGSGGYVDFYQLHFDRTKGKYVYADSLWPTVSSIIKFTTKASSAKFTVKCLSEGNVSGGGTPIIEQWTSEQTFFFGGPPKTSAKE